MELELEAPSLNEPLESQSIGQRDERDAHTSTNQRLSWYEMIEMDLAQERAESSQDKEVRYRLVDPLDDSLRDWLQQRFKESQSSGSMTWSEREQEAPSKATLMEEDQCITDQSDSQASGGSDSNKEFVGSWHQ